MVAGGIAVALAVTFVLPGGAQAATAASGAHRTAPETASAVAKSASTSSAASVGSSRASASAAAKPEANTFRTIAGRQSAVPEFSGSVTGTPRPAPSGPALYVDDAAGSGCSDTAAGAGTQAVPFCTLQAAANAVVAGGHGSGARPAILRRLQPLTNAQGTASAPITFESSILPSSPMQADSQIRIANALGEGAPSTPAHAIDVEGSSHVDFGELRSRRTRDE